MYVASQVALVVKNLPANTEDLRGAGSTLESRRSLEDGMATHYSPSLLCSLQNRPMNLRDEVFEARKMNLFGKPADQEDDRLAPQSNHLLRVCMPGSFIDERERSNEKLKSKGRTDCERQ